MLRRSLVVAASLLLSLGAGTSIAHAQEAEEEGSRQATGTFQSQDFELPIWGAYAFEDDDVGVQEVPGIKVAVSNYEFNSESLDRYWDRERWIRQRWLDQKTDVVWFHFTAEGEYDGLSYYFYSGNGCGLCYTPEVRSTVELRDGRIAGTLSLDDPERRIFDVTFDIPVAPSDYGDALPPDGGEAGATYRTYHEALGNGDSEAIRSTINEYRHQYLDEAEPFLSWLRRSHPTSYTLKQGFAQGDRALLLTVGEHSTFGTVRTEVHLVLEDGRWVIWDELMKMEGW